MEHEDLLPDIVVFGKGIGSGIPVSAVCSTSEIFSCLKKGEMSSTLGGNPVASAGVVAVLEIFEKENLVGNSAKLGEYIKNGLEAIVQKCPYLGIAIALTFITPRFWQFWTLVTPKRAITEYKLQS